MSRTAHIIIGAASTAAIALGVTMLRPTVPVKAGTTFDAAAAAKRMDERQNWWMNWPKAQRDHGTACVSCHTVLPYAMGRSELRKSMGETALSAPEQQMLSYVTKRVNGWADMEPYYNDVKSGAHKSVESRGTESVLNALVLARYDSVTGKMSPTEKTAFQNMWSMQLKEGDAAGAFDWLNFKLAPWESDTSQYYGAALAALAVGMAPEHYAATPAIQPQVHALHAYLAANYAAQPLVNRMVLLWAASYTPTLLKPEQKSTLIKEILAAQAPDGGWSLPSLGTWQRKDNTQESTKTDGYATGLAVYVLQRAGYSAKKPEMQNAIVWLTTHQTDQGAWTTVSLNKERDPKTDPALFMSDSATGFSVLALESVQ